MFLELFAFLVSVLLFYIISTIWENRSLPAGPFPLPFFGNALSFGAKPHLDLTSLAKTYGGIFRIQMGRRKVLVINSYSVAREALVKKANDFSGRPHHFLGSIFGRNCTDIVFQTFTQKWRAQQKDALAALRECESKIESDERNFLTQQVQELCNLFASHDGKPFQPREFVFRSIGTCFCSLIFGKQLPDTELNNLLSGIRIFAKCLGAANMIDAFPVLKYLPFEVINKAYQAGQDRDDIFEREYADHLSTFQHDLIRDVIDAMLKVDESSKVQSDADDFLERKQRLISSASDLFIAGTETTASVITWVILYVTKHPDVQARLHSHLDEVIGFEDRLPLLTDKQRLPYVQAVIAEVQRIASVLPLAVPHATLRDTSLAGFSVPRDTTVFLNLWAIHHDPNHWEEPFSFRPERFLDETGNFKVDGIMPYSVGRRSCTGESFARRAVFLYTSRLFYRFHFDFPSGETLPGAEDSDYGIVLDSKPFNICVTKRQKNR